MHKYYFIDTFLFIWQQSLSFMFYFLTWISNMMKHTTGWESNGKKHSFYGKSIRIKFSGLLHFMGFDDFSNAMGNLIRKPMHFPCDEVYHRMGISREKITHSMGKVWVPTSQVHPIRWVLYIWEIHGETHAFLIWWSIP